MILAPLLAALVQDETVREFVYVADRELKQVNIAGTFNGWNKGATPLKLDADGRTWRIKIPIGPGKHQYKFVLNDSEWIVDPKAEKNEDDGNGNTNSVLFILPPGYEKPAIAGDGSITLGALQHGTSVVWRNVDRGRLSVRFRSRLGDLDGVNLELDSKSLPMEKSSSDDFYQYWRVEVPESSPRSTYRFALRDRSIRYFGPNGFTERAGSLYDFMDYKPFETPAWAEGVVLYHIFPERFLNGNKENDPKDVLPWGSEPKYFNWMGGDLAGVKQKIPYLKALGVGGVYFNPLFEGPSNHGYETTDYLKIAPHFGTNEEFAALTHELDEQGMRTILDGVFNHTSTDFYAFKDLREKGEKSAYKDWFFPKSYPIKVEENPNYEAWFGFPSMPKLNLENPETRKALLDVPVFWHENAKIAGWRLDVANEVRQDYWQDFRKVMKGLGRDQWIVGEHWGDATPWLGGDQWDSVMGYQFRDACLRFFVDKTTTGKQFGERLMAVYESYPPQVSRSLMNLLSSHDTPRFKTLVKDDDLTLLAAAVLMSWPGAPSVYYGEEIGMEGGADPDNRRSMTWEAATDDNRFLKRYRLLIETRNHSKALRTGEPQVLHGDDHSFAFQRTDGDRVALLLGNRGKDPVSIRVRPQRRKMRDVLSGEDVDLTKPIVVPAKGARLLVD